MAGFDYPDSSPVTDAQGMATPAWRQTFSRWHTIILSVQQSGTTAQRPTKNLWIGRRYYDETLNKPVYLRSVNPAVWRDSDNAIDAAFTYDPPSMLDGTNASVAASVPGAALGDYVQVAAPYSLTAVLVTGYVPVADFVTVVLQNETGGTVDFASGTWKVRVTR